MTFIIESWFWRGTQSAVFYYLSCAPCTKVNDQRKKRREAKRAKVEREMAGTFRHPLPSGTNTGWDEEILRGPGPPPKRLKKEEVRRRNMIAMALKPPEIHETKPELAPSTGTTSIDTVDGQAVSQDLKNVNGEGWNRQRYQREDEVLWGLERADTTSSDGLSPNPGSAGGTSYRYYARNPEVNELHPPIVSTQPISRTEAQWMLQPPPKAKFMEGKERANRIRSASGISGSSSGIISRASSRRNGGDDLGRILGERALEEKLARRDGPLPVPSAQMVDSHALDSSTATSLGFRATTLLGLGQGHERDQGFFDLSTDSLDPPKPAQRPTSLRPTSCPDPYKSATIPTRPPLSAITSAANAPRSHLQPSEAADQPYPPPFASPQIVFPMQKQQRTSTDDQPRLTTENQTSHTSSMAANAEKTPFQSPEREQGSPPILKYMSGNYDRITGAFTSSFNESQTGHRWSMNP